MHEKKTVIFSYIFTLFSHLFLILFASVTWGVTNIPNILSLDLSLIIPLFHPSSLSFFLYDFILSL